jgi:hypothetical protein
VTHAARACLVACVLAGCLSRREPADRDAAERACAAQGACGLAEYCAFQPSLCGKGKRPGRCRPSPPACEAPLSPVCGCDGRVYGSECAAHAAGVDLAAAGGCQERVPGWIPCGPRYCDARASYCEIVLSDVFELPTDYACRTLPPTCLPVGDAAAECDCFPPETRCLSFCGHIASASSLSGFHLTCRL